jgi:hypothetical protein
MARQSRFVRALVAAILLGVLELAAIVTVDVTLNGAAQAQRYRRGGFGFFDSLFGGSDSGPGYGNYGPYGPYGPPERRSAPAAPAAESPRPPTPRKTDITPSTVVMVMGDGLADWLAYGLEEAFADSPEIGVVRKTKQYSGLIRYDAKSDLDWWHVAKDFVSGERVDYVVMMLGVEDRRSIREADSKKSDDAKADKTNSDNANSDKADTSTKPDDENGQDLIAPEAKRGGRGTAEFRTEEWEQIYTKRIDETIAAMKSKGVPVLWVGLPSIRGTRSTADASYLNELYRARAEKAGIVYVDIWDGFVDENGKFTYFGPDFEGQNRRLRAADGVNFTKNGARKLAHYVERELRRFMSNRSAPIAVPSQGPQGPVLSNSPAARPVAGPVVPLTGAVKGGDELLGGNSVRPALSDPVATQVLVKGEPVAPVSGRADDFHWRPEGGSAAVAPSQAPAAAPEIRVIRPAPKPSANEDNPAAHPAAAPRPAPHEANREPAPKIEPKHDRALPPAGPQRSAKPTAAKPETAAPKTAKPAVKPQPAPPADTRTVERSGPPRPPASIPQQRAPRRDDGFFGLFR